LGKTVNGAFGLNVNTSGTTTFSGDVGGTTPLASLTTNAGGTTSIVAANTTMTAANIEFDDLVSGTGAQNLTLNASGTIAFKGAAGGSANLGTLTLNATGAGPNAVTQTASASIKGNALVLQGSGGFLLNTSAGNDFATLTGPGLTSSATYPIRTLCRSVP